ncbi:uncharacterized protein B0303.7 isoform X2 [Venturia canescens]|uniref:uncharacterized protein B0303.7 isoform X2 n=1 Tax=Venturia canescens TaxID=32260 RepID=UPI001C9C08B0|nr:uncharacterized protein B0303.7 isoform X2 [Venturia canescens]
MVQKMPIPTRAAPRPPSNFGTQINSGWSNNDPFGTTMQPNQKKKPPPRPPPPRFKKDSFPRNDDKTKKPVRPTELLTNIFGRKTQRKQEIPNLALSSSRFQSGNSQSNSTVDPGVSLIDLSPPGSPTFTTRSNSDGVSVDSFGSDGNSNPSVFTSSGNTSQTESAFEDDFDFFGSLSSSKTSSNDPWKVTSSHDPFSQLSSSNASTSISTKRIGDANFFAYNDTLPSNSTTFNPPVTNSVATMPTIIRARPPKPPAPKCLNRSLAPIVTDFSHPSTSNFSNGNVPSGGSSGTTFNPINEWPDYDDNPSPPMPSIPPPAPPSEYLQEIEAPSNKTNAFPHGIALYDFAASQSGDLPLKQGETVTLLRAINEEWLEGRIGNRTGIFPANFVDVVVPLPGVSNHVVNALYTFNGETWEDLPFEEGAKITVLSKISNDWLFGEYRGKKGQFPANYVDRVPQDLPKSS